MKQIVLFIFFLVAAASCSQFDASVSPFGLNSADNEVEIETIKFEIRHLTLSEEWTYFPKEYVNILDYYEIDSVRFSANMRSQDFYENCIVELYDFTNDRPIRNSTVTSNVRFYFKYVESSNILPTFPQDEALLGIRIRSSREGNPVEVAYESQILIYSH